MLGRAFLLMIAGAIGGLLAWAVVEPMAPPEMTLKPMQAPVINPDGSFNPGAEFGGTGTEGAVQERQATPPPAIPEDFEEAWKRFTGWFGLAAGLFIGVMLGLASGYIQGSRTHVLRGVALGAILGVVGGTLGVTMGNALFMALGGDPHGNPLSPQQLIARSLGWGMFGLLIGLAEGAVGRSVQRSFQGALGGLLGGLAGGVSFNVSAALLGPLAVTLTEGAGGGTIPRAVGLVCVGGFIGLFIGLVEGLARTAWLRLSLGRNEGKEWVVDAAQTFIGRSEMAHVPLFGDPNIAPMHALIQRQGQTYMLIDGGSPLGTYLNGQRVQQAPLFHGAQVAIGQNVLQFLMRMGSAPQRAAEQLRAQSHLLSGPQQPAGVPSGAPAGGPTGYAPAPYPQDSGNQTVAVQPAVAASSLVVTAGPLLGQRFQVVQPLEVGREAQGVALGFDSSASRRHASFAPAPGGLLVTDLGSTNGTFVNDQRVQTATIRPGDLVRIGVTTFRVE